MKASISLVVMVVTMVGTLLAGAGAPEAASVQLVIAGALSAPSGTSQDGQITLRAGVGLSVLLVNGGAVVPGSVGTATAVRWSDTTPTSGFTSPADLIVLHFGSLMVVAAGINTPGGPVTTFSATPPFDGLSGTWTLAAGPGSGVSGAGAGDAVLTFNFEVSPVNPQQAQLMLYYTLLTSLSKPVQGVGTAGVNRNVPVYLIASDQVGPPIGTMTYYDVSSIPGHAGTDFAGITAINVGGFYVLYACAFPDAVTGIACLVGGNGPVARLSGHADVLAGQFVTPGHPYGVTIYDQLVTLTVSLP